MAGCCSGSGSGKSATRQAPQPRALSERVGRCERAGPSHPPRKNSDNGLEQHLSLLQVAGQPLQIEDAAMAESCCTTLGRGATHQRRLREVQCLVERAVYGRDCRRGQRHARGQLWRARQRRGRGRRRGRRRRHSRVCA